MKKQNLITQTAATIDRFLNITPNENMEPENEKVLRTAKKMFREEPCDRVFFYNPDAIAMWLYRKYQTEFRELEENVQIRMQIHTVFPPVTPVCFGSMYTGLEPEKHGIMKYKKPVLQVNTVFDDIVKAGLKAAVISTSGDSISKIFLDREIDYFIYETVEECNQKAMEIIQEDQYHFIVLYNGNYDYKMHRFGPEGTKALDALKENIDTFQKIYGRIKECWKNHNTVLAFAPDHGCHKQFLVLGGHGVDKPCDMETVHFYSFLPAEQKNENKE